jgi:2-phosphosulfolactate phosphatase
VRVDVAFTPAESRGLVAGRAVVVIDVLRATSTIVHALANGARNVLPLAGVEDAVRKADELGRDAVLLCGERDTQPIRGFHLGNSPLEFTPERIAGKPLIMTTTNGTQALLAAAGAQAMFVGSLLNVTAVAGRLAESQRDVLLLCAGREGSFALEDAICAGRIARLVRERVETVHGNDALKAAVRLARTAPSERLLARTAAGRRLIELGRREDIAFCAQEDVHDVVPILDEHRIRLQPAAA